MPEFVPSATQREQALQLNAQLRQIMSGLQSESPEQVQWVQSLQAPLFKKLEETTGVVHSLAAVPLLTCDLGPAGRVGKISQGDEVLTLQKILRALGYKTALTGSFDLPTTSAIRALQARTRLALSSIVEAETRDLLNELAWGLTLESEEPIAEPVTNKVPRDPLLLVHDLGSPGKMRALSKGPEVIILQKALRKLGFKLALTGQFDAPTSLAVRNYQSKHKLPLTGQLDARSREMFNRTLHNMRLRTVAEWAEAGRQEAPEIEDILAMPEPVDQGLVTELSSDLGPADRAGFVSEGAEVIFLQEILRGEDLELKLTGDYDTATTVAVRSFQLQHKLPVNGVVDKRSRPILNASLQRLRLKNEALEAYSEKIADLAVFCNVQITAHKEQAMESLLMHLLSLLVQTEARVTVSHEYPEPELKKRLYLHSNLSTRGQLGIVSEGDEVVLLSTLMSTLAFEIEPQTKFDLKMYGELKRLQHEYAIPATGICDEQTRSILNEILEQAYISDEAMRDFHLLTRDYLQRFGQALSLERLTQIQETLGQLLKLVRGEVSAAEANNAYFGLPALLSEELGPANRAGKTHQGPQVSLLQRVLMQQGHKLQENASYDGATYNAVRSFQMGQKLPMTGVVDLRTRDAINLLLPPPEKQ